MTPGMIVAGRYKLKRRIGEGGMGQVFEAIHTGLNRRVAIKVLHKNASKKDGLVERLEREAKASAAVGHVNIVEVMDFGVHEDMPFMVMEYLEGESLLDRLERAKKLPLEDAAFVIGQILSALSAAHAAGIVHRDLKPENVLLVKRGDQNDLVKLLDFGISKVMNESAPGRPITREGMVVGTPFYMAPEQAMARADVDGGADIYSAGVMLYEMLTGRLPFNAASEAEVLMKICRREEEPPWPSELDSSLPPELDSIVVRALAFNRADRYPTAGEMLDALRPFGAAALSIVPDRATGKFRSLTPPSGVAAPGRASTPGPTVIERVDLNRATDSIPAVPMRSGRIVRWSVAGGGLAAVIAIVAFVAFRSGHAPGPTSPQRRAATSPSAIPSAPRALPPVAPAVQPAGAVPVAAPTPEPSAVPLAPAVEDTSGTTAAAPPHASGALPHGVPRRVVHTNATSGRGATTPANAGQRPRGAFIRATTEY